MPSREPELYKDKIEVSLDGRQIFYLFFGGAVLVGLVFVLGVMVGRRVEARGHLDRAETQAASDPLAALDRLERSDSLSFHGALTGSDTPTDVDKAIGEIEKRRAAGKPETRTEKLDARPEPVTKPDDKPKADKHDGDRRAKKHDDSAAGETRSESRPDRSDARRSDAKGDKPVTKPETRADAKADARADAKADARPEARTDARPTSTSESDAKPGTESKVRFTLQLSSFQDKSEAEAFLTAMKSAGYQPYLTEADVTGKGTFYRVRLGSYRSLEAASDAKAEYEKAAKKTAQVMRL